RNATSSLGERPTVAGRTDSRPIESARGKRRWHRVWGNRGGEVRRSNHVAGEWNCPNGLIRCVASRCLAIAPGDQLATMTRPERCWLAGGGQGAVRAPRKLQQARGKHKSR